MSDTRPAGSASGRRKDKSRGFFSTPSAQCALLYTGLTVLIMVVFVISLIPQKYHLREGQIPTVTIASTKDVVDEITTEEKKNEAARNVAVVTDYDDQVKGRVMAKLEQILSEMRSINQFARTLDKKAGEGYTKEELRYAGSMLSTMVLADYQLRTLMDTSTEDFESLCNNMYSVVDNTMNAHITEAQLSDTINSISTIIGYKLNPLLLQNVVRPVLRECIEPNVVPNKEKTEEERQKARDGIDAVMIAQGQYIVIKGEGRITKSQIAVLRSLGLMDGNSTNLTGYLGSSALVLIIMLFLYLVLAHISVGLTRTFRRMLILCLVTGITVLLCAAARMLQLYLMPVLLAVLLLTSLDSLRAGLSVNTALSALMVVFILGFSNNDSTGVIRVVLMTLTGGTIAGLIMRKSGSRVKSLIAGAAAAVVNLAVIFGISMITVYSWTDVLNDALISMAGPVLAGLLAMALQPLLESWLNLPTAVHLLELSNPNSPLLKRLMIEAPGTYHHSILVANLAEASAEAVGADPVLARVGAYYHDIGKLKRPQYFSENQSNGVNVHDQTEPEVSARILTAHPRDGVALAREYRLPLEIQAIIANHHGNSPVMYFYHKAVQQAGGKPVDINAFRYEGNKPSTKEEAIIMLCDTIEAAVRSRKDSMTEEELTGYIVKLVRGKLSDGQLNNAPLTLRDIDLICTACTIVLKGVNHERVSYPGDKKPGHRPAAPRTDRPAQRPIRPDTRPVPVVPPAAVKTAAPVVPVPPSPESMMVDELLQNQPKPEEIETENAPGFIQPGRDPNEDLNEKTPDSEPADEETNNE